VAAGELVSDDLVETVVHRLLSEHEGNRHGNLSPRTNLTIEPPERTWNRPRRWFVHGDLVRSPQFVAFSSEAPRKLVLVGERGAGVPSGLWMLKNLSPLRYPARFLGDHEGANSHHTHSAVRDTPLRNPALPAPAKDQWMRRR
jgi:hypothetical protein